MRVKRKVSTVAGRNLYWIEEIFAEDRERYRRLRRELCESAAREGRETIIE